jgi:squalene-associated FAD-dependent desaturase
MTGTVHVVGAGLAGLSAALTAVRRGARVRLYEGAQHAGGRCRSYFDERLGRTIDNGNHLVLSGNRSVERYLRRARAYGVFEMMPEARFAFFDARSGERWDVAINDGPLPFWLLDQARRPKGVGLSDMLLLGGLLRAKGTDTVADVCGAAGPAAERFVEPMTMAVVNLPPHLASAQLLRSTAVEAWRDGRLARPLMAPQGLGAALIDPALAALTEAGAELSFGRLLKGLRTDEGRVVSLQFAREEDVPVGPKERVVLALPPHRLSAVMPGVSVPTGSASILNAHFVVGDRRLLEGKPKLLGLTNALTQWVFLKGDIVSLTVSAADHVAGPAQAEDAVLERLWSEASAALDLPPGTPFEAGRLVREKRATFLQTPENVRLRPKQRTRYENLYLAGDYTDTGLPATIESAVRSGERAAKLAA